MTKTKEQQTVVAEKTEASMPTVANTDVMVTEEAQKKAAEVAKAIIKEASSEDSVDVYKVISSIGKEEVVSLREMSEALEMPISDLASGGESDKVSNQLVELKVNVEEIDPGKFDLEPGFFGRMLQKITGTSALNKYFTKFQSAKGVISSIVRTLEEGKRALEEDNIVFQSDKEKYRKTLEQLKEKIAVLMELDKLIEEEAKKETDPAKKKFLQEEVLFSIKQRLIDLQQTMAVTGQGIIAIDMLIRNNQELIRGVDRAINVTTSALSVGVTIMAGLATQKKVLEKTQAVNEATDEIILSSSRMLKDQGAKIQKQAASATMDIKKLEEAVKNAIQAVEDVETFKQKALPDMSNAISSLHSLNNTVVEKVKKMEEAEKKQLR